MIFRSSSWPWQSLAAPWHQNPVGPKGTITVTQKRGKYSHRCHLGVSRLQKAFQPAHTACQAQSWLCAWLAHEMLLAHFPVLFHVSFQQDEPHPGMANGENPSGCAGAKGFNSAATFYQQTMSRLWLEHCTGKKKQPRHECGGFTFSCLY